MNYKTKQQKKMFVKQIENKKTTNHPRNSNKNKHFQQLVENKMMMMINWSKESEGVINKQINGYE